MFSVDGGTVTVCWTQQCPVVNCPIAEHQWQRRLGHQQLCTATGGHPAGVSERTADVVLTACWTNVADQQPSMMELCRSVSGRRSSPAWTADAWVLSTNGNWRVCRWCGSSATNRQWIVWQRWVPTGGGCTGSLVSLPAQHCRSPARTWWGRRRVFGKRTSAPNLECCAADKEWQSSWQRFSECGITCWGRHQK